ncbi:DNA repair protein [Ilyomonas limi]|uniref:DNA repair protein n=2 Tax=Ilyomonas limi TaxID=2575867 RepID=A0A4V5UW93_9BACT|nr:DNA repair protein [Ilyomonas limi]
MESLCTAQEGIQVSEVELVYKTKIKASERLQVSTSKEVYELLKRYWDENKIEFVEQFKILLLNRSNRVLGIYEISTGGLAGTVADPKVVFIAALRVAASHIILAHNHPSGNLNPSIQDKQLTQKIKDGGKLLDIEVIDHLIISKDGYYSFADEGLL